MQTTLSFKPIKQQNKVSKVDPAEAVDEAPGDFNKIFHDPDCFLRCLDKSWRIHLESEVRKPYFVKMLEKLKESKDNILPPKDSILNSFNYCPFSKVKVVIIGQDPYHDIGQAHGLSFSVQKGVKVPPSLVNIYKELKNTYGDSFQIPTHGYLESWARQGVLLLNASLTVVAHEANSHSKIGWSTFTNAAISAVNQHLSGVVFIAWGNNAKSICKSINGSKHMLLQSGHPSPLSQTHFFGCDHFRKANQYLLSVDKTPINWNSLNE